MERKSIQMKNYLKLSECDKSITKTENFQKRGGIASDRLWISVNTNVFNEASDFRS